MPSIKTANNIPHWNFKAAIKVRLNKLNMADLKRVKYKKQKSRQKYIKHVYTVARTDSSDNPPLGL